MPETEHLLLKQVVKSNSEGKEEGVLKAGENNHLKAELFTAVDENENPIGKDLYSGVADLGAKVRKPGWTNIGDISACLRTSIGLGEIYKNSKTPHIAVASKHTRPVVVARHIHPFPFTEICRFTRSLAYPR